MGGEAQCNAGLGNDNLCYGMYKIRQKKNAIQVDQKGSRQGLSGRQNMLTLCRQPGKLHGSFNLKAMSLQ